MTLARYLLGVALTAVALVPVAGGAWALRGRLLPGWSGPPARVAEATIALALVLAVAQLLGVVGLFRLGFVVALLAAAGTTAWVVGRRGRAGGGTPAAPPPAPATPTVARLVAGVGVIVLFTSWMPRVIDAARHGMSNVDTLWYHLPAAARFVQDASLTQLHFFDRDLATVTIFYPQNAAVFHAVGLLLLGTDAASVIINLAWLALALLAAWSIGRPHGVAPTTMLGAALLLATPVLASTQPGGAYNDTACLAVVLAAIALLVNGGTTGAPGTLAAIAAATGLGMKLTMIAPVILLAAGAVAITPAGARRRVLATWSAALLLFGTLWYARNLIAAGNPLPSTSFGPLNLPTPELPPDTGKVADYLTRRDIWSDYYLPGLSRAFGAAWWAVLAPALAGLVLGLTARRERMLRMVAGVGALSALAYVATPQALGPPDRPVFFVYNTRYAAVAIAIGLVLLPLVPLAAGRLARNGLLGTYALLIAVLQIEPSTWPTGLRDTPFAEAVRGAEAVAAVVLGAGALAALAAWWRLGRPRPHWPAGTPRRVTATLAGLAVIAAGWVAVDAYLDGRYRDTPPLRSIYAWARDVRHARIATVGSFAALQYPLYGPDARNRVVYLARRGRHGAFLPITTCPDWRRALNAGRYRYVMTTLHTGGGAAPEARWTRSADGARLLRADRPVAEVYEITRPLDPETCPRGTETATPATPSGTAGGGQG